jgi:hypothetical protein
MSNRGIRGSSRQGPVTVISERSDDGFERASDEIFPASVFSISDAIGHRPMA